MAMTIELDVEVAAALQARADLLGISLSEFLAQIASLTPPANQPEDLTDEELEAAVDAASDSLPTSDFTYSREDIYFDHD